MQPRGDARDGIVDSSAFPKIDRASRENRDADGNNF